MKNISIEINNAKIESYSVELKDQLPEVNATIGLFSGEKQISSFSLNTQGFYQGVKFDLPARMIQPIIDIAHELENILTDQCKKSFVALPAHEEN